MVFGAPTADLLCVGIQLPRNSTTSTLVKCFLVGRQCGKGSLRRYDKNLSGFGVVEKYFADMLYTVG